MSVLSDEFQIKMVPNAAPILSFPNLTIRPNQRQVLLEEKTIKLSQLEFNTLLYLAQQPGRVFTKEQIYQHLYAMEPAEDVNNIIYCLLSSLRKKLEPDPRHPQYIHTVRGVGYKFQVDFDG